MTQIIKTTDIDAPVSEVYGRWTRFEDFPSFIDEVDSVTQESDTRTAWTVTVGGQTRRFSTDITEQHPDERVAWNSTDGDVDHAGVVTFHRLSDTTTRVTVQIDWEPEGVAEKVGSVVGIPDHAVQHALDRFKDFVEHHGGAEGWRGDVSA